MRIIEVEQGSPEWLEARLGKVTGTRLAAALGTPRAQETLINELIAEQVTELINETPVNAAMQRGTDEEPFAVKAYEKKYGVKTKEVGFCVSDRFEWLALSPDRLIEKSKKFTKGVEVKSPTTKTTIEYIRANKIPTTYWPQVKNYFHVVEDMQELDFLIYDPRIMYEHMQLTVFTVKRKDIEDELAADTKKLEEFGKRWETALIELTF
jgi:putative phage-type endonuclease